MCLLFVNECPDSQRQDARGSILHAAGTLAPGSCRALGVPHPMLCVYSVQVVILRWLRYATVCQMGKLRLREDRWSGSARLRQDCGSPSRSSSGPVLFWLFLLAHHTLLLACSLEWLPRPSASVLFQDLPNRTSHWCFFFRTQP